MSGSVNRIEIRYNRSSSINDRYYDNNAVDIDLKTAIHIYSYFYHDHQFPLIYFIWNVCVSIVNTHNEFDHEPGLFGVLLLDTECDSNVSTTKNIFAFNDKLGCTVASDILRQLQ